AERITCYERGGAEPLGKRATDPRHLAPVEDDPVRGWRNRREHPLLVAERHDPERAGPRSLEAVEDARLRVRLPGRDRLEVRLAAEVHVVDSEAALHRQKRRYRRVDPARQ